MELEGLAVLCALRAEGSISASARALGLSRTTAWRRLNALEEAVGCRLVERTQRNHRLTEAGREAARRGRTLLEEADALREAAQAAHRGTHGVLRVAVPPTAEALMVQGLAFARQQLPGLRAVVYESPEPRDPLRDDFDLVATYTRPEDEGLYIQRLEVMEWTLVASEAYVELYGAPQTVEALADHPLWIHYLPDDSTTTLPLKGGGAVLVTPTCATTNPSVVMHALEQGLGLGFLPRQIWGGRGGFRPILTEEVGGQRELYLVAGLRQRDSPRLQLAGQIMDWIRDAWLGEGAASGPEEAPLGDGPLRAPPT